MTSSKWLLPHNLSQIDHLSIIVIPIIHTFLSAQFAWQCVVGRSIVLSIVLLGINLCWQPATSQADWFHMGTLCHLCSWTLLWHVCLPVRVLWVRVGIGFFGFARSCLSILRFLRHFSYDSSYLGYRWKICYSLLWPKNELYRQTGSSALWYTLCVQTLIAADRSFLLPI